MLAEMDWGEPRSGTRVTSEEGLVRWWRMTSERVAEGRRVTRNG